MTAKLPGKVIMRLTSYHFILNDELAHARKTVSSARIASLLKIDGSQVRKDIALCGILGKGNVGYDALELRGAIERFLGFRDRKNAFIIGAGNLGLALAKFKDFTDYGVDVLALFDTNPLKAELAVADKTVYPMSRLRDLAKGLNVEIAILTVPGRSAQRAADQIVAAGMKFIWNFSPVIITVPDRVKVRTENLIGGLLEFINQ